MVDVEKAKIEAKEIMDKFSQALNKVKQKIEESYIEREEDRRQERQEKDYEKYEKDQEFKQIMFKNAPKKEDDYIIAEKKKW